jgi:hypothetical protein
MVHILSTGLINLASRPMDPLLNFQSAMVSMIWPPLIQLPLLLTANDPGAEIVEIQSNERAGSACLPIVKVNLLDKDW